jgi:hypothetical protein
VASPLDAEKKQYIVAGVLFVKNTAEVYETGCFGSRF